MSNVLIESEALAVRINPQVGGTITGVRHKASGLSVLGSVPWPTVDAPLPGLAARDEPEWLTRYTGGWPLLFPNAGDACTVDDVFHGFHGEASIAPWEVVKSESQRLVIERRFVSVSAFMRREFSVEGEMLTVGEALSFTGHGHADVMWGHHPTFGSDLLDGAFEITCGAADVSVEPQYDPLANPLLPGASGHWPHVPGKGGPVDLSRPAAPWGSLVYLRHFRRPWAAIRRLDDTIAAVLSWDGERFPCAWLWYELDGNAGEPWAGRTRLIGIEPSTTPCALGLAESKRRGVPLLRLEARRELTSDIRLQVFRPSGPILNPQFTPTSARPS